MQRSCVPVAMAVALLVLTSGPLRALTLKPGTLWPSAKIPVCWEDTRREHKQERDLIRKSVKWTWERESAVKFTGWRKCRPGDRGIHISFDSTYPQTRGRGTEIDGLARGMQLPSLWSLAALSVNMKAPVHEFGHALGFGHEYARLDAPNYEVCAAGTSVGKRYTEDDRPITPFDFDSIMVACLRGATVEFSRGTPKLSALDIYGLVQSYGSHPDNVLDADEAGDRFGAALLARDLTGNGVPDLAVGAPGEDDGVGAVYLYRGDAIRGLRPWARLTPPDGERGFGKVLGWSEGDGESPDTAILMTENNHGYAVSAPRRGAPTLRRVYGESPSASSQSAASVPEGAFGFPEIVGTTVAVSIDLNGDNNPEMIVGAPDAGENASGVVAVYQGMLKADADGHLVRPWYWFGQAY